MHPEASPDRRTVVTGAAAALVGVGTLAACGSSDPAPTSTTTATPTGGESESESESESGTATGGSGSANAIVKLADVPVGGAVLATGPTGTIVVAQPAAGQVVAFSAICTHQGCKVAPAGATLNCPCHGSKFEAATGKVLNGPARADLAKVSVKVSGQDVVAG